jgi:tyrosyl-tRNA synthetase
MSIISELTQRGLIEQISNENLEKELSEKPATIYVGYDPTAESLHLGHLVPIMALSHFQTMGHQVIVVIGGATGMIGDPSGKSEERNLLTTDIVKKNAEGLKKQLSRFINFSGKNAAIMVDNNEWISKMSFTDWLREVGKHLSLSYMLSKESVKTRLNSEQGISFTEFSYMTMQAFDFLFLYRNYNCNIQGGGNDQWGNITAGIDLVRRVEGAKVSGITFPLLTTSRGEKFGKSAGNAIWLDPEKTSPFALYQYLIQTTDADIKKFLKFFTFLSISEIDDICHEHASNPENRSAQKKLAEEITRMIHGEDSLTKAKTATEALFGGDLNGLNEQELQEVFADAPSTTLPAELLHRGIDMVSLLTECKIFESKGKARRKIREKGVYLNNIRVAEEEFVINQNSLLTDSMIVIRTGKKAYHLVRFIDMGSDKE